MWRIEIRDREQPNKLKQLVWADQPCKSNLVSLDQFAVMTRVPDRSEVKAVTKSNNNPKGVLCGTCRRKKDLVEHLEATKRMREITRSNVLTFPSKRSV